MGNPIYIRTAGNILYAVSRHGLNPDSDNPDRLYIEYMGIPSEKDIDALLTLLDMPQFQITRLIIDVNFQIIQTEKFKQLIKKLDPDALHYLRLKFDEMGSHVNQSSRKAANQVLITSGIADLASYPLCVGNPLYDNYVSYQDNTLATKIISNIHRHQQQPRTTKQKKTSEDDEQLPKIKLKDIISNQTLREDDNLVSIDVTVETEAEVDAEIEMEVEINIDVDAETESSYTGSKLNYKEFKKYILFDSPMSAAFQSRNFFHPDSYSSDMELELFAPLPHALQYITPVAADRMCRDYSQMGSFNMNNLPPGMFLQKTPEGALVLDYDPSYKDNHNTFTPMDTLRYEEDEPPYFSAGELPDDFPEIKLPFNLQAPLWYKSILKSHSMNHIVRYGKQGIEDFLNLFNSSLVDNELNQSALSLQTIFTHYVCSYDNFDFMINASWFKACIQRIKQENDDAKLACFTSLLQVSINARHDLEHTLNAFDVFWEEVKKLCEKDMTEVPFGKIIFPKWTQNYHPKLGQTDRRSGMPPVVLMERTLTILKNARNIASQIDYLQDLSPGPFGSYYASVYEGFTMVHEDMDLSFASDSYKMHYLTALPSNLTYFKNTFVLLGDELFYINAAAERQPVAYTENLESYSRFQGGGKHLLTKLKEKKCMQLFKSRLYELTDFIPAPPLFNQHAKVYQVDLSTLRDMALKEDVIDYPTFYVYLHRYMGQQQEGIDYADFREQTKACDFNQKDKTIAFALLFFMTDQSYDKKLGILPLIDRIKKLKPTMIQKLAETLYTLYDKGIVFNNEEGISILDDLLNKQPQAVLETLKDQKMTTRSYDEVLNKFKMIGLKIKKAIKESQIDLSQVPIILNAIQSFSPTHQQALFEELKTDPQNIPSRCDQLTQLRVAALPPAYIVHYTRLKVPNCDIVLDRFNTDQHDPILAYILSPHFFDTGTEAQKLLDLTASHLNKHKIVALLKNNPILQYIRDPVVLDILAKGSATLLPNQKLTMEQWQELIQRLSSLETPQLTGLADLYKMTAPNSLCLFNALKQDGLDKLEREPFGPRDDARHFDVSQVERVVNTSLNWSNGDDTVYSYTYRKQLMEAFTFVNAIGYQLPFFEGKTVKELSNTEIQSYFLGIKNKSMFQNLSPFQQQLIALSIIREALYRSTGQMAYSTQLIAIIDCLMHKGHVISNIDTGQGKSLIDMAKSALLWLESDRVDITTSAIVDAKRDLENFSPFLSFLNIPHGQKPITTQSELSEFVPNGINISTFAQMALFQASMKLAGKSLGKKIEVVSLIVNESDYSLLEDRTVYRCASQSTQSLKPSAEWIYTAINQFVITPQFTARTTSAQRDVVNLKAFLNYYAATHHKSANVINEIHFDQWLKWINGALLVQYKLKENVDFIVPKTQQAVTIRGKKRMSHVVKLLMAEGKVKTKVSHDAKFGNGVQQLLYAKLNETYPEKLFIIEPESQILLSTNNRNVLEQYLKRTHPGKIWGSSGTAGAAPERKELYAKYQIEFSKIAPHQTKKITLHDASFYRNQTTQFEAIRKKIASVKLDDQTKPQLIFCKDIHSARKLYTFLANTHPDNLQLYTGEENEEACIAQAAKGGMITVCTAAIGRNTDILYNRAIGMNVMHTSINSYNLETQLTGRTGRQGSHGVIDFYFNEQELGKKTKIQIQDEIYQNSLKDRAFNEEIYSILDAVLTQVLNEIEKQSSQQSPLSHPPSEIDFLNHTWPKLSIKYENLYKELKMNEQYDREIFVKQLIDELREYPLDAQAILNTVTHQFEAKLPYTPYTADVTLKDCVPPVELSYALLNKDKIQPLDDATKAQIKSRVQGILKDYKNSKKIDFHADYIQYLTRSQATQDEIRDIHQACIKAFLDKHNEYRPLPWYKRLFGYQSKLNQITHSAHYLILFRSLMSVPSTVENASTVFDMVKKTTLTLIKEYQDAWFIHDERKKFARQLIQDLEHINDLPTMIKMLNTCQITLAQKDREINKNRWFQLHTYGSSRLQNTISGALNLASALQEEVIDNTKDLLDELDQTDKNNKKVIQQQINTIVHLRKRSFLAEPVFPAKEGSQKPELDATLMKI